METSKPPDPAPSNPAETSASTDPGSSIPSGPASEAGSSKKPLTYSSYLLVDELLELQKLQSLDPERTGPDGEPVGEHDEMLFIIIHQVYELWFKQILHELQRIQPAFEEGDTATVLDTLKRVLTILKTLVGQVDILETMTPTSFNSFRDRLDSASGFQSSQFREVEFLLGHKNPKMAFYHPLGSRGRQRLEALSEAPSLWDSFLRYLVTQGYEVPREQLERDVRKPIEPDPGVQEVLLRVYREDHRTTQVCERLVDLDEGLQEWRYRHVKMVERTIGTRIGTGGSSGAEYLRKTLFRPLFPDLWEIRAQL